VLTPVLGDGTAIGELLAIWRYLEEFYPTAPLLGTAPRVCIVSNALGRQSSLRIFAYDARADGGWPTTSQC
jgi:glutathione S-transferase